MSGLTIDNPVKFADVLISKNVLPGDTLLLRGGKYSGDWVIAWGGTAEAPVTIKPYNGEPVAIDGSLQILGDYITIMDLDFTDTRTDPKTITQGVYASGTGFKMYGCHISKQHASGLHWYGHGAGEVAENWIEDNGYLDDDGNTHGYCLYGHNETKGEHFIRRNLMKPRKEKYSLHLFTASPTPLYDYRVTHNVFWGPVHTGGGYGLQDCRFENNIQYGDWVQLGAYMYDPAYANNGGTIKDNLFIDTLIYYPPNKDNVLPWADLVESGNIAWSPYRPEHFDRDGYTVQDAPANWEQFIPFTVSERWAGIQATLADGVFNAAIVGK